MKFETRNGEQKQEKALMMVRVSISWRNLQLTGRKFSKQRKQLETTSRTMKIVNKNNQTNL
jgi:hypothetical protein